MLPPLVYSITLFDTQTTVLGNTSLFLVLCDGINVMGFLCVHSSGCDAVKLWMGNLPLSLSPISQPLFCSLFLYYFALRNSSTKNVSVVIKLFKFTLLVISDISPPVGHKRRNLKNQHVVLFHITTLWPWLSSSNKGTTKVVYMTFALYSESLEDFMYILTIHLDVCGVTASCCKVWALLTVR